MCLRLTLCMTSLIVGSNSAPPACHVALGLCMTSLIVGSNSGMHSIKSAVEAVYDLVNSGVEQQICARPPGATPLCMTSLIVGSNSWIAVWIEQDKAVYDLVNSGVEQPNPA